MSMTGDVWVFIIVLLGLVFLPMSRQNILFALVDSVFWLFLFFRLFFGTSPFIGLNEEFSEMLVYAFLVLAIVPWVIRWDVELRNEAKGRGGISQVWKSWGAKPTIGPPDRREEYRKMLRGRLGRRR